MSQELPSETHQMDAIIELRGRKIGFRRTQWGGELHAVERGYFPCSPTGFWSLSGYARGHSAEVPTQEALEALAVTKDNENASLLKRCHTALRQPGRPYGVAGFISASSAAELALAHGFYAAPAMRADLWRIAFRIYTAIIETPEAHPGHSSQCLNRGAWTPEYCDIAFQRIVDCRNWLRDLLEGVFSLPDGLSPQIRVSAGSYFDLPPVAEASAGAPTLEMSFGLDLSSPVAETSNEDEDEAQDFDDDLPESEDDDESEPDTVSTELVASVTTDEQLSLF